MQLNEIFENHTIKEITKKTNISEKNLGYLLSLEFEKLQKIKVLGFISILEREYNANLSEFKEDALEYYASHNRASSIAVGVPHMDERRRGGKSLPLVLLAILAIVVASWYFFTQFDKKHLQGLITFSEDEIVKTSLKTETKLEDDKPATLNPAATMVSSTVVVSKTNNSDDTNETQVEDNTSVALNAIFIKPKNRLWFGLINPITKKRDHFSIKEPYRLEVEKDAWLIATSSAGFSLLKGEKEEKYDDAKEHYFKIDKEGIKSLNKDEYVGLGGWRQW